MAGRAETGDTQIGRRGPGRGRELQRQQGMGWFFFLRAMSASWCMNVRGEVEQNRIEVTGKTSVAVS